MITFCVQRSSEIVMEYTGQLHSSNMKRVLGLPSLEEPYRARLMLKYKLEINANNLNI